MERKAVIFDLDGTLIDSMQVWRKVDAEFLGSRGIKVPDDLFEHLPNGNSFIQTAQYFKDRFELPDSVQSIMNEWTQMVTHHYQQDILLKVGAAELVHDLVSQGILLGLATSNSRFLASAVLSRSGIWDCFTASVTGEEVKMGKPYPEIYQKTACLLDIEAQDCIVLEDTLSGVQAGKAAGMKVIAIYDADNLDQIPKIKSVADFYAEDYTQVRRILCNINYIS